MEKEPKLSPEPRKPESTNSLRRIFSRKFLAVATAFAVSNAVFACDRAPQGDGIPDYIMEEELVRKYPRVFDILIQQKKESYREGLYNVVDVIEKTIEFFDKYSAGELPEISEYEPLGSPEEGASYVLAAEAQERYAAKVAHLLYLDDNEMLPWNIDDLSYEDLQIILNFNEYFMLSTDGHYISMGSYYYPSHPERIHEFLWEHDLIKETPEETLYAITDWARLNFKHVSYESENTPEDKKLHNDQWGTPELMEVLNQIDDKGQVVVDGCHGTASIYWQLLGTIGIPAERISPKRGHSGINFPSIGKFTTHADNLYSKRFSRSGRDLLSSRMLPDIPESLDIHITENAETLENLEDRHYFNAELAMPYPSDDIAAWYGRNTYNPLRENPEVRTRIYSALGEKNADELIARIDARLEEIGGGNKLDGAAILINEWLYL